MRKIETGKKYVQRNGEVVTVLSTVAAGEYPVVIQFEGGAIGTRTVSGGFGGWCGLDPYDLVSEYVEPRKVVEVWVVLGGSELATTWFTSGEAKACSVRNGGTVYHLREVNPAREKAVEELVREVKWFTAAFPSGKATRGISDALAALDAAERAK